MSLLFWKMEALGSNTYDLEINPLDLDKSPIFKYKIRTLIVALYFPNANVRNNIIHGCEHTLETVNVDFNNPNKYLGYHVGNDMDWPCVSSYSMSFQ